MSFELSPFVRQVVLMNVFLRSCLVFVDAHPSLARPVPLTVHGCEHSETCSIPNKKHSDF